MVQLLPLITVSALVALGGMSCGGKGGSDPSPVVSESNSPSPSLDPSPEPPEGTPSLADDFSDPSTGWDGNETAKYQDGRLVVGDPAPAGVLVPSPLTFLGARVVTATASVEGPGRSVIGLFCGGNLHLSSAYIGFIDLPNETATIGRLSSAGAEIMGRGAHIDEVVSLEEPLSLGLRCTQAAGAQRISLEVDGIQVAIGVDPTPLQGPAGGLYFEYTRGGAVGIFDDFDMVPLSNSN
jgi:hypothetical protein